MRVGINGMGRIGRLALRAAMGGVYRPTDDPRTNAAGRLMGILLSGALTQSGGMEACLWGSAAMLAICLGITLLLPSGAAARRVAA